MQLSIDLHTYTKVLNISLYFEDVKKIYREVYIISDCSNLRPGIISCL